jgi:hypothetical protein
MNFIEHVLLIFIKHLPALKQAAWIRWAMEADEKPKDAGEV